MIHRRGSRGSINGSHKRDLENEYNAKAIFSLTDKKLSIGDEEMDMLESTSHNLARMLERGTGRLRKCKKCGDVHVNQQANERRFGTWINKNGFLCYFCRSGEKRPMTKVAKKKREVMQKVWDLYIKRINIGVTTIKK